MIGGMFAIGVVYIFYIVHTMYEFIRTRFTKVTNE